MSTQLTPKQEAFAMAYVETGNASEAYRRAYDASRMKAETVNRKAAELLANGKITARVAALKAEHRQRHAITVDDLVSDLLRIRALAEDSGQLGVARQAVMDIGKLLGLDVTRVESRHTIGTELNIHKALAILRGLGIEPELNHDHH